MSRSVGPRLDSALLERFSGRDLDARRGEAILLVTLDEAHRPHPALLSHAEVAAPGPGAVRLGVATASGTARNLAARRAVTLCFVDGARVVYVKARTAGVAGGVVANHPRLAWFDAAVEDVLVDEAHPDEAVTRVSGFTFDTARPAEGLRAGQALQAALRLAR